MICIWRTATSAGSTQTLHMLSSLPVAIPPSLWLPHAQIWCHPSPSPAAVVLGIVWWGIKNNSSQKKTSVARASASSSSGLFSLVSQHSLLCCWVRYVVMEAEIHQQYGRESLGFNIFPSMLPLKNEKNAISAQVAVKMSLEKPNFIRADDRRYQQQPGTCGEHVCFFLF